MLFNPDKAIAQHQENIIKTAYLGKFVGYIDWPDNKASDDNQFTIAIAGDAELCAFVGEAFHKQRMKNMEVEVICFDGVQGKKDIDLLVLASDRLKDLDEAKELCLKYHCLLVTNTTGFARKGAHINFFITEEKTLHFEMNKASLDNAGFKVDFLLLDYAKVVKK